MANKGTASNLFKHGMSRSPEHRTWCKMIERCYNPNHEHYAYYGGRGITICDRWRHSFLNFYSDMGPRPSSKHSIERINNAGGYEPNNCKWATNLEQSNNKRNTFTVTYLSETKGISEWCRLLGLSYAATKKRILRGWSPDRAFNQPKRTSNG